MLGNGAAVDAELGSQVFDPGAGLVALHQALQGDLLILMNSYNSDALVRDAVRNQPQTSVGYLKQGRIPRLKFPSAEPVSPQQLASAAWCPPGHGELISLLVNGLARQLLNRGFDYLFVSNMDNLAATVDMRIPTYMKTKQLPWVTEVCRRTLSDIKGGHVAISKKSGRFLVRDSNMTDDADWGAYCDIDRHSYFNTNNLWLDLRVAAELPRSTPFLLPLIINRKEVTVGTAEVDVVQLETGMGTAICLFKDAQVIEVPRARFVPVKDKRQFDLLRSDWFTFDADGLISEPNADSRPDVRFDDDIDFDTRV